MPRTTPPSLIAYQEVVYNGTTTPRSFTSITWLTGDVITVIAGGSGGGVGNAEGPPTVTGLTFTAQKTHPAASNCSAGVWTAIAASGSSGAVSIPSTEVPNAWGASLWQWRGSDGVGASILPTPASSQSSSLTPTDTHSALMWGVFDWSATAVGSTVAAPAATHTDESALEGAGAYSAYVFDIADQASAAAVNVGVSGNGGTGPFTIVAIEVLGTGSGSVDEAYLPRGQLIGV